MAYQHGIKPRSIATPSGTINVNPTCVIGLIGVSPFGPTQQLVLCNNEKDDAQFGEPTPDNTIAKSLAKIRKAVKAASTTGSDGSCLVVVVNVFNPMSHTVLLDGPGGFGDTLQLFDDGSTGYNINATILNSVSELTLYNLDAEVAFEGVQGVDWTINKYGRMRIINTENNFEAGDDVSVLRVDGFTIYDISSVSGTDIKGAVDSDGNRTGLKLFDLVESLYGFKVKVLLCPVFEQLSTVRDALISAASSYRGVFLSDLPQGTTFTQTLTARASGGAWATSDPALIPLWPEMVEYDDYTMTDIPYAYAAYYAGLIVATDNNQDGGYADVPDNIELPVGVAPAFNITTGWEDPNSDANRLNAAGIVTYNRDYGRALIAWGTRNAAYPAGDNLKLSFINIYRADGIITDTMVTAAKPYVGRRITKALIDIIVAEGNNLMRSLIQKGVVVPGSEVQYRPGDNPAEDLAAGILRIRRVYMVTPVAELIVLDNVMDTTLLANIK